MNSPIRSRKWITLVSTALLLVPALSLRAQDFNTGSDGSYGAINITENTRLTTPVDGIFKCTTLTVEANKVLTFTRNALNSPIQILATGDVNIAGTISVDASGPVDGNGRTSGGVGGPGGFDGGASGYSINSAVQSAPGEGQGPGGGRTAGDGYAARAGHYAGTYGGKFLLPIIGGSGGGGGQGDGWWGGGGGGAILIASNTKITVTGVISANGTWSYNQGGSGSGGAVRLVAPRVFGNGSLQATEPTGQSQGFGIIRVDSIFKVDPLDSTQRLAFRYTGAATAGGNFVLSVPRKVLIQSVAGRDVDPTSTGPVTFLLPAGTNPSQVVAVQVTEVTIPGSIGVHLAVVPESGERRVYDYVSTTTTGATITRPLNLTFAVEFPTNVLCHLQAWSD